MSRSPAVALIILMAACRREHSRPQASLPAAARVTPSYTPPADGRLTERQLAEFLRVARRKANPAGPAADLASAVVGMNPDEYLWVELKVLEARIAIEDGEANRRNTETYRKTIASLKNVLSVSKDPPTRESLNRQIGELERELAEAERAVRRPVPPDEAFNQALLARHRREIESVSSRLLESP